MRHNVFPPRGAIHRRGEGGSDDACRARRRPSRKTLPLVGRPSSVGVEVAYKSNCGVPGGQPKILWGRGVDIPFVLAASEALARKRPICPSCCDSVAQLRWHRGCAGR